MKKFKRIYELLINRIKIKADSIKTKFKNFIKSEYFKFLAKFLNVCVSVSAIITMIFVILAFKNISNQDDLNDYIKSRPNSQKAIVEWQKELSYIRIGCNKDYIENIIGQPPILETIKLDTSTYIKATYSNSYFSLFCVYKEDLSLLGYLIIGNNDGFKLCNYRCNFSLFDYSINEAEEYCYENGLASILFFRNNHSNRLDANSYYFECNLQHSKGAIEPCLIGYGICDIGKINSYDEFYKVANDMQICHNTNESYFELYEKSQNDSIRNFPINSFLIMSYTDDSMELLNNYLIPYSCLGMSRSEYANLQQDYSSCIDFFLKILKISKLF